MKGSHIYPLHRLNNERLDQIIADPQSSQKHALWARIIVASDDGLGTNAIMATTGKSKTCVWRWQKRFMDEGVHGLLDDKTRTRHPTNCGRACRRDHV